VYPPSSPRRPFAASAASCAPRSSPPSPLLPFVAVPRRADELAFSRSPSSPSPACSAVFCSPSGLSGARGPLVDLVLLGRGALRPRLAVCSKGRVTLVSFPLHTYGKGMLKLTRGGECPPPQRTEKWPPSSALKTTKKTTIARALQRVQDSPQLWCVCSS